MVVHVSPHAHEREAKGFVPGNWAPIHFEKNMLAASFWIDHPPSDSRALVEFGLKDRKVFLSGIFFVRGNVIDINAIRAMHKHARLMLL